MVLNEQSRARVDVASLRVFMRRLLRTLRLEGAEFNVCLVDDRGMRELNARFRGVARATDVLSFPFEANESGAGLRRRALPAREFAGFLGDVVISTETAQQNARAEGHTLAREIRWLIVHGLLHLAGYDHERDRGEMTRVELKLRARLGLEDRKGKR